MKHNRNLFVFSAIVGLIMVVMPSCRSYSASDGFNTASGSIVDSAEAAILNEIFGSEKGAFDFKGKKIAFRGTEWGKKFYFEMYLQHEKDSEKPFDKGYLHIFSPEGKMESGGYDAAILYWQKFLLPEQQIVKRIKKYKARYEKEAND